MDPHELERLEERDAHLPIPSAPPCPWGDDSKKAKAADPGLLPLSMKRLKDVAPLYFSWFRHPAKLFRILGPEDFAKADVALIRYILWNGDSNPAYVMSVDPFLVAAYSADIDTVVLLKFHKHDAQDNGLSVGDRLLSVNYYYKLDDGKHARDLVPGKGDSGRWQNFEPMIADLLSDYRGRIERRKAELSEDLWARALELAEEAMARPDRTHRSGNPALSGWPA